MRFKELLKNLLQIADFMERKGGVFFTYALRPEHSEHFALRKKSTLYPKCGIVIQGPVVTDRNFTLETAKIYRKIFPEATIVVSTWNDENPDVLNEFRKENITLVLSEKPEQGKPWGPNFNLQLVSSLAGVKMCRELNCEYVLKTRTDQRIYRPDAMRFFYCLTEEFPVAADCKQKKRIIGVSLNTFKYRLYGLSDMTVFGSTDDMLLFWGAELDYRDISADHATTNRLFSILNIGEVYLVTEFMKKINYDLQWTLKDSWNVFAEHFCVVDQQSIELYWHKYSRHDEYRHPKYYYATTGKELSFSEWLEMHCNLQNLEINENIPDLPHRERTE